VTNERTPPEDQPVTEVDARGSHGMQVGDHGTQYNMFTDRRLNAVSLEALSPHTAASQLARMPSDDAALVLATAPIDASAEVLKVLLSADEGRRLAIWLRKHSGPWAWCCGG
jgi:hypothetical protein